MKALKTEDETIEFLRLCMTCLDNKGYEVYVSNTRLASFYFAENGEVGGIA